VEVGAALEAARAVAFPSQATMLASLGQL